MRLLLLFLLLAGVSFAANEPSPSPTPPFDRKVILRVKLDTSQREFHIGEIIPLRLFFSSRTKNRYQVDTAGYDRSGRMNLEDFHVTPSKGTVDPIPPDALSIIGGGLRGFQFLEPKPWSIWLNLVEWVRFDEPGEYQLVVTSTRVSVRDRHSAYGLSTVTARSNQITVKILPSDREWQKRTFQQAVATLGPSPADEVGVAGEPPTPLEMAWDTLRYLGTPEAAAELARRLRPDTQGNGNFICYMGLVCSPAQAAARDALHKELADPDHPISDTFLETLRMVDAGYHHPADPYSAEEKKKRDDAERKVLEEVVAVLPNKRGQALPLTLYAATELAWGLQPPPQPTLDKLVGELITKFDQLPLHEQSLLLVYRWEKIRGPALLPLVKRYAQATEESLQKMGLNTWDATDIVAKGIRYWFDLDPVGARPFVIQEITRPTPRFGVNVLGILPDATLPEVDGQLAEHLAAIDDYETSTRLAELIARYGTPAILPRILKELNAHHTKWSCETQNLLLAYVLRVDPEAARPLIERALAAQAKASCNPNLFEQIPKIHYDPVLEEIAIHALDNPKLGSSAATMLSTFGSAAAETPLWRCYERWCKRWAGHESKLSVVSDDDYNNELVAERATGVALVEALAKGRGWLMDRAKLQQLKEMTKVPAVRDEADRYLALWAEEPLTVRVGRDWFSVGHYTNEKIEPFEQKLTEFPSGTNFAIEPLDDSAANLKNVELVRAFLLSHRMSVKEIKSPE
jgi:hypothetical protein